VAYKIKEEIGLPHVQHVT